MIINRPPPSYLYTVAKGLVAKLTPPYAQSAWGSKGKRVWAMGLVTCCNYFSKKKKDLYTVIKTPTFALILQSAFLKAIPRFQL